VIAVTQKLASSDHKVMSVVLRMAVVMLLKFVPVRVKIALRIRFYLEILCATCQVVSVRTMQRAMEGLKPVRLRLIKAEELCAAISVPIVMLLNIALATALSAPMITQDRVPRAV